MNFKLITPQRFPNEKNDCVVIAVSEVEGIPYAQAYNKVFSDSNRRFKHGCSVIQYVKGKSYQNNMPKSAGPSPLGKLYHPSLWEVVHTHRIGKYIVCTRNHAMALIDGVIHDLSEPKWRSGIMEIWKYEL